MQTKIRLTRIQYVIASVIISDHLSLYTNSQTCFERFWMTKSLLSNFPYQHRVLHPVVCSSHCLGCLNRACQRLLRMVDERYDWSHIPLVIIQYRWRKPLAIFMAKMQGNKDQLCDPFTYKQKVSKVSSFTTVSTRCFNTRYIRSN